jgi:hypothetical protein
VPLLEELLQVAEGVDVDLRQVPQLDRVQSRQGSRPPGQDGLGGMIIRITCIFAVYRPASGEQANVRSCR